MKKNITILALFTFLILSMISSSLFLKQKYLENKANREVNLTENVKGTTDLSNIPIIKNIAPTIAYIGQEYRYDLGVMDADTYYTDIKVSINEGPSWLKVDKLSLVGVPPFYALDTNKVVVKVSDGENFTLYTFYILVQKSDENL